MSALVGGSSSEQVWTRLWSWSPDVTNIGGRGSLYREVPCPGAARARGSLSNEVSCPGAAGAQEVPVQWDPMCKGWGGTGGRGLYSESNASWVWSHEIPLDRLTDRHDWKHEIPATSLTGGNNSWKISLLLIGSIKVTVYHLTPESYSCIIITKHRQNAP